MCFSRLSARLFSGLRTRLTVGVEVVEEGVRGWLVKERRYSKSIDEEDLRSKQRRKKLVMEWLVGRREVRGLKERGFINASSCSKPIGRPACLM